ncbi:hypothetical protein BX616_000051 [Lobosporangium transversale]|uniref:Large ribosomal subunit protein bL32m n=1 Tax=Lobosporangium transversale TaxID=64571 RepID=A0A1Y2GIU1_9FUNG|nr:hypothetical protein BCR41DRAFT_356451 [Lobosporangium transversale]KAF9917743.1 hypothetical protein BX616_000051 [Lobosporangium transversale]ORZ12071.1 hypothetical protein BCR41DRAFT_356451 [Lobosporangium transversale]|eukprot:XP_021879936.1 hypothetical protein BCR41DRAFT_356451 [Lobosporangium transversale]
MSLLNIASRAVKPTSNLVILRAFSSYSVVRPTSSAFIINDNNNNTLSATNSSTTVLGRLGSYISDLLPSIVWASVPKSKTSHSKKRMRQATKGLKEQHNIVQCPGCGHAKLMHHLCMHCYRDMKGRGPSSRTLA